MRLVWQRLETTPDPRTATGRAYQWTTVTSASRPPRGVWVRAQPNCWELAVHSVTTVTSPNLHTLLTHAARALQDPTAALRRHFDTLAHAAEKAARFDER